MNNAVQTNEEAGKNSENSKPVKALRSNRMASTAKKRKEFVVGSASCPKGSNAEIPVLAVLSQSTSGMRTVLVLKEVRGPKWYPKLTATDLQARYANSRKNCVDTSIKFAKKHLVVKGEAYPPSHENPFGIWRISPKGMERLRKERDSWVAKYATYSDRLIEI
jgi:hypothetical protein